MPTQVFDANGGGQGRVFNGNANYNTARTASSGTANTDGTFGNSLSGGTYTVQRYFLPFNTAVIPANATIESAFLRLVADGATFNNADTDTIDVVASTQASDTALANEDFDQAGATTFGALALASWTNSAGANNDITLNATGLAAIIKGGGYTKLGCRMRSDITPATPTGLNQVGLQATDIRLSVTYSVPSESGDFKFL